MGRRGQCRRKDEERRQAACLLCTAALVALIIVLIVLYFTVWKPRDPQLQLPTMQLLSLETSGSGPGSTVTDASATVAVQVQHVSLNLQVVLYNPNRGVFWVSNGSGVCLYYDNRQVGFTPIASAFIPAQALGTATVVVNSATPFIITPVTPTTTATSTSFSPEQMLPPSPATTAAVFSSFSSHSSSQPAPTNATNGISSSSVSVSAYSSQPLLPPTGGAPFQLTSTASIVGHVRTANGLFSHHAYIICKCHITICFGSGPGTMTPFIHSYYCERTYSPPRQ